MNKLMEFTTEDGAVVVVEATDGAGGTRLVGRGEGGPAAQAARTLEGTLDGVRSAAQSALRVFRDGSLRPDSVELEFGVKLTAVRRPARRAAEQARGSRVHLAGRCRPHDRGCLRAAQPDAAAAPGRRARPVTCSGVRACRARHRRRSPAPRGEPRWKTPIQRRPARPPPEGARPRAPRRMWARGPPTGRAPKAPRTREVPP